MMQTGYSSGKSSRVQFGPCGILFCGLLAFGCLGTHPATSPPPSQPMHQSDIVDQVSAQEALRRAATHEYALRRLAYARESLDKKAYVEAIHACADILNELSETERYHQLRAQAIELQSEAHYGEAHRLRALDQPMQALSMARMAEHLGHPQAARLAGSIMTQMQAPR